MDLRTPKKNLSTLKDLYPDLNEDEYALIDFNFKRYMQLVWRINQSQHSRQLLLLTEKSRPARVKGPAR